RRVAGEERAVAPPTGVVTAAEVRELPPLRGGDDHLAGIRARERAPDALERVRILVLNEDARVSRGRPAALVRSEADLVAVFARNRLAVLEEEREVDGSNAVEPLGQLPRRLSTERIDHPRAVRGGDNRVAAVWHRPAPSRKDVEIGESVLQGNDPIDARLAVVRADDDRVAVEEGFVASGGRHELPDRGVCALQCLHGGIGPRDVRRVVVVRQVKDEEVEAVARDKPAADRRGIGIHRSLRPRADGEWRARDVGLEQVEEEEPAWAVDGLVPAVPPGPERQLDWMPRPAAITGEVDRGGL